MALCIVTDVVETVAIDGTCASGTKIYSAAEAQALYGATNSPWHIDGEGGALVGAAILAVWAVAWAFKVIGRFINQS